MQQELKKIEAEAHRRLELASDNDAVSLIRSEILGKKGSLGAVLRGMGKLPAEERPKVGQLVNEVKSRIESSIDEALGRLDAAAETKLSKQVDSTSLDQDVRSALVHLILSSK